MKASTKLILVLIILTVIGILVYQIYQSSSSCWPFCPGLNDEEKAVLEEGFEQKDKSPEENDNEGAIDLNLTEEERNQIEQDLILAGCPDEMIVDKMPTIGDNQNSSYYVKDGKRIEITEYNPIWVKANCEVPVTEVW